jgi:hypothetical protein
VRGVEPQQPRISLAAESAVERHHPLDPTLGSYAEQISTCSTSMARAASSTTAVAVEGIGGAFAGSAEAAPRWWRSSMPTSPGASVRHRNAGQRRVLDDLRRRRQREFAQWGRYTRPGGKIDHETPTARPGVRLQRQHSADGLSAAQ